MAKYCFFTEKSAKKFNDGFEIKLDKEWLDNKDTIIFNKTNNKYLYNKIDSLYSGYYNLSLNFYSVFSNEKIDIDTLIDTPVIEIYDCNDNLKKSIIMVKTKEMSAISKGASLYKLSNNDIYYNNLYYPNCDDSESLKTFFNTNKYNISGKFYIEKNDYIKLRIGTNKIINNFSYIVCSDIKLIYLAFEK